MYLIYAYVDITKGWREVLSGVVSHTYTTTISHGEIAFEKCANDTCLKSFNDQLMICWFATTGKVIIFFNLGYTKLYSICKQNVEI